MHELFKNRRLIITLALLYLSQGIPIGLAIGAIPVLLRHDGATIKALSFLPLVTLPWVLKFTWAPIVDNYWLKSLGRRHSWILPMQAIVILCMLILATIGITLASASWTVILLILTSLASSTQDIATDGMAAEYSSETMLSKVNAIQIAGVMIGYFIGQDGILILTGYFNQHIALLILTTVPLLSWFSILLLKPQPTSKKQETTKLVTTASLVNFIKRPYAPSLILLALLSAMTAVSGFTLAKIFLQDLGWKIETIGLLGMTGGAVTILLGCGGGAWLIKKIGVWQAFMIGISCAAISSLLWFLQAIQWLPLNIYYVWACIVLASISTGITSVAIMTAGMQFASLGNQAGTDMTSVQSTRDLGEMLANSSLLALTAAIGYKGGFLCCMILASVALIIASYSCRSSLKNRVS